MRRGLFWALAVLVGCSGTAGTMATIEDEDSGLDHDAGPNLDSSSQVDGFLLDVGLDVNSTSDTSDVSLDSVTDTNADTAIDAVDDVSDAGPDVLPDAPVDEDAGTDAPDAEPPPFDAGPDVEPEPPDTGPPPICLPGQTRCNNFKFERCQAANWKWQTGDQRCCTQEGRYTLGQTTSIDTTTGLVWNNTGGHGNSRQGAEELCSGLPSLPNGRLATTAELMHLVIGPPDNNISVCSPTIDSEAFSNVNPGDTWTSDGCVDLLRGISKAECSGVGFLCVSN